MLRFPTTANNSNISIKDFISLNRMDLPKQTTDQIQATLLGQCIGDALGLLTEFMTKEEAKKVIMWLFLLNLSVPVTLWHYWYRAIYG